MPSPDSAPAELDAGYRLARLGRDARRGVLRWLAAHLAGHHRAGAWRYV
jgi:hypothetical protein